MTCDCKWCKAAHQIEKHLTAEKGISTAVFFSAILSLRVFPGVPGAWAVRFASGAMIGNWPDGY